MDWEKAFALFISDKRAIGRSGATLEFYRIGWTRFKRFWDGSTEIDRFLLRSYLAHLGEEMKPISVQTNWRCVRAFLKWCHYEELIPSDPTLKVRPPQVVAEKKTPLIESELMRIFSVAKTPRDRALLALIIDTGLRRREVSDLKASDIDIVSRCVTVTRGKNGKRRDVPLSIDATREMRRWLDKRDSGITWLFYSLQGTTRGSKLEGNGVFQIVRRLAKQAGFKGVGTHTLRHSMSRSFIVQGGNVATLQSILGHSSLETTNRYVKLNFTDLTTEHSSHSPFAATKRAGGVKR
jgi:integrase/recombinase XerD